MTRTSLESLPSGPEQVREVKDLELGSKSLRKPSSLVIENQETSKSDRRIDPLLSPQQAAEYLGVKPKFIYERIARNEIESQPVGRLKRIRLTPKAEKNDECSTFYDLDHE